MSNFKIGDYIMQSGRDSNTYALVIGEQVNGGNKVISIQEWRGIAAIDSTKGWHPEPVKISKEDIPENLLKKIEKKANMSNKSAMDSVLAMRDTDMVPREMVTEVCGNCAEKMRREGMRAIRASIIKEALIGSEIKKAMKGTDR